MPSFDIAKIVHETPVAHVEFHETLDSTNRLALDLIDELAPFGWSVVVTENQTAGRGRGSNSWWAMPGALTFTLVVNTRELTLPVERLPLISLAAGLAVRNTVAQHVAERRVCVKWPNDVLIGEQKVCGILTQHQYAGSDAALLIGIGLNVNNSLTSAPDDVRRRAVSLFDATSESHDLTEVLVTVVQQFRHVVAELNSRARWFLSELNTHSLLNHRTIAVECPDRTYAGECLGIDEDGALLLRTEQGTERLFAGTVIQW